MSHVLIIEDEPNVCRALQNALESTALKISVAGSAREGIQCVRDNRPDAVILAVRLPDMSGLEACARIRKIEARLPVIMIVAPDTAETAIKAMASGVFDYLLQPLDIQHAREVVAGAVHLSRIRRLPAIYDGNQVTDSEGGQLVGYAIAMQELFASIGRVAPQDVTVLIQGENGTGKELVARAIYQHSRRSQMPLYTINCAATAELLLESELFGHEQGAFAVADQRRIGRVEQAHGGTIFLDEVGDMAPGTQAKLLRLLEESQFQRVGGDTAIHSDIRVIAATNQDLESLAAAGHFRQDLCSRLNVLRIRIPPLRERIEDIPLLLKYFLSRVNREVERPELTVSPEAMQLLQQHRWPGNVRELQSAVIYALAQISGDVLTPDVLPPHLQKKSPQVKVLAARHAVDLAVAKLAQEILAQKGGEIYDEVQTVVDRAVLREVLEHAKGNQGVAAELLGISRTTLRFKLRALKMVVERQVTDAGE